MYSFYLLFNGERFEKSMANVKYASGWTRLIAETTDHDTAMKFVFAFGGRRFRIPLKATPKTLIARAIGLEAARKISAKFGDQRIDVSQERRNMSIWLRDQGFSQEDIAHVLRISRKVVQQYLAGDFDPQPMGIWGNKP